LSDEDLEFEARGRKFVPLEKLESTLAKADYTDKVKGHFTVGVLVEKSGVRKSKTGKTFVILSFTDLQKYDLAKLKKAYAREDEIKTLKEIKKHFENGYKVAKVFVFGECAHTAHLIPVGSVLGILNIKAMGQHGSGGESEGGQAYIVDNEKQFLKIGVSYDLGTCKGRT